MSDDEPAAIEWREDTQAECPYDRETKIVQAIEKENEGV